MNVLIDLRWMVIGRAGGLEQMAYELVAAIPKVCGEDSFYLYCSERVFCDWLFKSDSKMKLIDSDRFQLVSERVDYDRSEQCCRRMLTKLGVAAVDGSKQGLRILDIDLVHSIGGYVHDELLNYRNVLTVHDLQHIHMPYNFDETEIATRNARYLTSIRASEAVISVSDFVKRDIVTQYGVKEDNVFTIWNIPSGSPSKRFPESKVSRILREMGIDFDFLFFPSHGWPHKNHLVLVEAFLFVRESIPDLRMVFTGGSFEKKHPAAEKIHSLGLGDSVVHIGYRTPTEVRCLYQGAKALVYPSLFEGFGMPVAESIEAGTPVVCSEIEPLVDVGGDAIVTFDPSNPKDIADKIVSVLQNDRLRSKLLRHGEEQQKRFSGEAITLRTYNLYRSCCGLDLLEEKDCSSKAAIRCESTRHWGRVCERKFRAGRRTSGIMALLVTAWLSWPLARAVYRTLKREKTNRDKGFHGRYGDGWIGVKYRDWFMVPKEAKALELDLVAPPFPHADDFGIKVVVERNEIGVFRFEDDSTLRVTIDLKHGIGELIRLEIDSNQSFKPNKQVQNGDERELAIKLVGINWN